MPTSFSGGIAGTMTDPEGSKYVDDGTIDDSISHDDPKTVSSRTSQGVSEF